MNNCKRSLFLTAVFAVSTWSLVVRSQDAEPAAEMAVPEGAMTQGKFAIKFASQLGLWAGLSRPLTESKATSLLTEIGVTPFAGWNANAILGPNDFARMLVQALDELDEIDDAEEDNPETTAYMDFLKRKFNLDINEVNFADAKIVQTTEKTPSGQFRDSVSTSPLENRGQDGEIDELNAGGLSKGVPSFPVSSFVTVEEVNRVIVSIPPSQGRGTDGRVDEDSDNTTPSAPAPPAPTATPIPLPTIPMPTGTPMIMYPTPMFNGG